jgi:phosphotransferase system HPr (HPr) family protein
VNNFETLVRLRERAVQPKSVNGTRVPFPLSVGRPLPSCDTRAALRETFTVKQIQGMHARPCSLLIQTLHPLRCDISVRCGDQEANGRSIIGLLSLAAGCHSKLLFTISGPDAGAALAEIKRLFDAGFDQAYEPVASNPS